MLWLLLWLLQAVNRRPQVDCAYASRRCNAAAGDLGEGGVNGLVAVSLHTPLGGLLWLLVLWLLVLWLLVLWLLLWLLLALWLWLLRLWLLFLWLLPLLRWWPWPVLPVGSGDEGAAAAVATWVGALAALRLWGPCSCPCPCPRSCLRLQRPHLPLGR